MHKPFWISAVRLSLLPALQPMLSVATVTAIGLLACAGPFSQGAEAKLGPSVLAQQPVKVKPRITGRVGGRVPGATRGGEQCMGSGSAYQAYANQMSALVPVTNTAYTASETPTLLVYLPAGPARMAKLSITNEAKQAKTLTVPLSGQAGVTAIQLPALKLNQDYKVSFAVLCSNVQANQAVAPFVESNIRRMQLSPMAYRMISKSPSQEQFKLYDSQGLWIDAIASLAQQRRLAPANAQLNAAWDAMLKSDYVRLAEVAPAPLL
jgi:hypothetical protein